MWRNYLTIAIRNLERQRAYTFINAVGLAIGMAACLLIGLYIQDELSYDRFHEHADRLMVVGRETSFGVGRAMPYPLGTAMAEQLPEVEAVARVLADRMLEVQWPDGGSFEVHAAMADTNVFDVLSFPVVAGAAFSGRSGPDDALVTRSLARRLFGEADPLGQTVTYISRTDGARTEHELTVAGVLADVPGPSTLQFELLLPVMHLPSAYHAEAGWGLQLFDTYVLLHAPMPAEAFSGRVMDVMTPILDELHQVGRYFGVALPDLYLSDLYVGNGYTGQRRYIYLFGSIAVLILLIASINYINLMTARAGQRAREVGVRKTLGAYRSQLVFQFLSESCLLSVLALMLALLFTELTLPAFGRLFGKTFEASLLAYAGPLVVLSLGTLAVGLLAGLYPVLVLSRFRPVHVLRGSFRPGRGGGLRRLLVVSQFTITIVLLLGTFIVYQQLRYMQNVSPGFEEEQVVVVNLPSRSSRELHESIRQEMLSHGGVEQASAASAVPGDIGTQAGYKPTTVAPGARTERETVTFYDVRADAAYFSTLGLEMVAGRAPSAELESDRTSAFVLNEAAVAQLGWTPEEAVGQAFMINGPDWPGEVVGVVRNFHFQSMHEEIAPLVLRLWHHPSIEASPYRLIAARLSPGAVAPAMDYLEAVVKRYAPDALFDYHFLDERFDAMYRAEERLGRIFNLFAVVATVIACLGLFGLAAFTAERRTKEIGIRKVLGASVAGLVVLLSSEFARLVALAFCVAAPVAYLAMTRWLEAFAYRVELGWGVFVLAGVLALVLALMTVSVQAVRAALTDPVESLRYE